MPIYQAIILGLTQGLSEFLPISSSGHLILVPWLFGWDTFEGNPGLQKAFDVSLHIGTLVAVIAYFRRDLAAFVREGLAAVRDPARRDSTEARMPWLLLASSVPAAVVGALFSSTIEESLGGPVLIAVQLIGFGLLLEFADRQQGTKRLEQYRLRHAMLVGSAQMLALSPGVSRSGSTITAARFLGFDRDAAARVSFLMSLPVTGGAVLFKLADTMAEGGFPRALWGALAVGIVTSGVAGWLAVWGTIKLVRTRSFTPFVVYRVALGILVLVVAAAGWR